MIRLLLLHLLLSNPPPHGILNGIAQIETRSFRDDRGFHYVDRRDGSHGELGPWQVTYDAYEAVAAHPSRSEFETLRDPVICRQFAIAYLCFLHAESGKEWPLVIGLYHVGLHGRPKQGVEYAQRVCDVGGVVIAP